MLIEAKGISKSYSVGADSITVLHKIDFFTEGNDFVAVMGPSGSGKSTLLYILGCLELPSKGSYLFDGKDVLNASDRELSHIRANQIGFVFQTFNLVPALTVYENIELPFFYSNHREKIKTAHILDAVDRVGLRKRITHKPSQLSGGEMQRVAIARALAVKPKLILADEPTGNLDSATSREIMTLFRELHEDGAAIVIVTHDHNVAEWAAKIIHIIDGTIHLSPGAV